MDKNKQSQFDRRRFLQSTALIGGATTIANFGPGLQVAFGGDGINKNIFVYIFMRGGPDWLSIVTPMNGNPARADYDGLRVNGTNISSSQLLPLADNWGVNPNGAAFKSLFDAGELAVVLAAGLPFSNRSHFEAERFVELGTPGNRFTTSGWLARHLQSSINLPGQIPIPGMTAEGNISLSLLNEPSILSLSNPSGFELDGGGDIFEDQLQVALADVYSFGDTDIEVAGTQSLEAVNIVQSIFDSEYTPDNGAQYPTRGQTEGTENDNLTDLASELLNIARLIKGGTGVRVAQADRGGWDTHDDQRPLMLSGMGGRINDVSLCVEAFLSDLDVDTGEGDTWKDRTAVLMMGEFGRRAFDNDGAGTDHGYAGNILIAGGAAVNGGQVYGTFPGLGEDDLFQGADVRATTDYRNVFSEMLIRHLGNPELGTTLPGFDSSSQLGGYNPLGIFNGDDMEPNLGAQDVISRIGFE